MNNPFIEALINRNKYIQCSQNEEESRRQKYRQEYSIKVDNKIQEICEIISTSTENVIKIIELSALELLKRSKAIASTSIWEYYDPFTCCLIEKLETLGVKVYHNPNVLHLPSLVIYVDQINVVNRS
jgi:hypothetical protein